MYCSAVFSGSVVFAKKSQSINLDGEQYTTKIESFTHKRVYDVIVAKKFLNEQDHVLIIDDFLANGCAVAGLIDLVHSAGASIEGVGIAVEKGFQTGGKLLRDKGRESGVLSHCGKHECRYGRDCIQIRILGR